MKKHQKKRKELKRSGCLTVFLASIFITSTVAIISALALRSFPIWARIIFVIEAMLAIVFAGAIWRWKKWGAYGFGATGLIGLIYAAYHPDYQPLYQLLVAMVEIAIWIYLLRPFWDDMS